MQNSQRLRILICVFALSAVLVGYDQMGRPNTGAVAQAVPRSGPQPQAATRASPSPVSVSGDAGRAAIGALASRAAYADASGNAFVSLAPPPPPAALMPQSMPVEEPVVPVAPPLPYTVIGKKQEAGGWEVYLSKGDDTYLAHVGDTLDETYRVAAISPPTMTLVYLPLNEQQTLQIGASLHD